MPFFWGYDQSKIVCLDVVVMGRFAYFIVYAVEMDTFFGGSPFKDRNEHIPLEWAHLKTGWKRNRYWRIQSEYKKANKNRESKGGKIHESSILHAFTPIFVWFSFHIASKFFDNKFILCSSHTI